MSSPATVTAWRDAYADIAHRLSRDAPRAEQMLTGTSACIDAIFHISPERMSRLAAAAHTVPATADDARGRELVAKLLERVYAGRGGEILTRWSGGPPWVLSVLGEPDRRQLGGTGPQASWALAVVGAPSVLALADRSAAQLAVIDGRTGVCVDRSVRPAGSVAPSGEPTKLLHCILEFGAGTPLGEGIVPRSTRLILRFGDEPIERDEQFAALTPTIPGVRAGLLSGLNGLPDSDVDSRDWLMRLGRSWADAGVRVIHQELAEFPSPERLRHALDIRVATSIGLSLSELFALSGRRDDPRLLARDVAERAGATRVIVHADDFALAVHHDPDPDPTNVLLAGSVLAAARARAGQPSDDLVPPDEATLTDDLPASGPLGDGWRAASVPSPYLRRPAATVGLGDTFVAGVLLAESLP